MGAYILRRLFVSLLIVIIIISLSFFLVRFAKGGPFDQERSLPKNVKQQLISRYGLDKPLLQQYIHYMSRIFQLDFGYSLKYQGRKVVDIIKENLPYSLQLGILALLVAVLTGVSLGLLASKTEKKGIDTLLQYIALFFISIPAIVMAPLLILIFAFLLKLLPAGLWGGPKHLLLPVIALAFPFAARLLLLIREKALETKKASFIQAARGRGVAEKQIFFKHVLKNSLAPVIAYMAPGAAALLTGSVVVETIFVLPGLGKYFVQAAFNRDFTLIIGVVVVYSTLLILLNLLSDIILQSIDPRIRIAQRGEQ